MKFGEAVEALKQGKRVKRKNWGGYWSLEEWDKGLVRSVPFITAYLKDDGGYAPAQPYQTDVLAEDWEVIK